MQKEINIEMFDKTYSGWIERLLSKGKNNNELLPIIVRASKLYFGVNEEWEDVYCKGRYCVSSFGRVKRLKRQKKFAKNGINPFINEKYLYLSRHTNKSLGVKLCVKGKTKSITVHQLVAMAFLGHIPNGYSLVVNHKNFNRFDNRVDNLEIVTQRENANKKHLKSSSKYTGVSWDKHGNSWQSYIHIDGRLKHLGRFKNEIDAYSAYQNALYKHEVLILHKL